MDSPLPERFDISDGDDAGMEYGDGDQYESLHESYEVQEEIISILPYQDLLCLVGKQHLFVPSFGQVT